jgi:hypothetical protein
VAGEEGRKGYLREDWTFWDEADWRSLISRGTVSDLGVLWWIAPIWAAATVIFRDMIWDCGMLTEKELECDGYSQTLR